MSSGITHKTTGDGTKVTDTVWSEEHDVDVTKLHDLLSTTPSTLHSSLALSKVDLEGVWVKHGLTFGDDLCVHSMLSGMCYDPNTYNFYVTIPDTSEESATTLIVKINQYGHVVASRLVTDRNYVVPVIANGGKLYAAEYRTSGKFDELSTTDLSLTQNIISFGATYKRAFSIIKASDTEVILFGGGSGGSPGESHFHVIDIPNKTKTDYDIGAGSIQNPLKVGNMVYFDRYGEFTGNMKVDLSDYSDSAMGSPPSTTNDLTPMFEHDGYIWHGEFGGGAAFDQEIYKYKISDESWTELAANDYPGYNDKGGNWGALYFSEFSRAIWLRGCTRHYQRPTGQYIFNPDTEKFLNITHLFDGIMASPTVLETDASVTGDVTMKRLSHDNTNLGGTPIDDDGVHCGPRPVGFTNADGKYKFLIGCKLRTFDDPDELAKPVLVFGEV